MRMSCRSSTAGSLLAALVCILLSSCSRSGGGGAPTPDGRIIYRPKAARYEGITRARTQHEVNGQVTINDVGFEYHLTTDVSADDGMVQATVVVDAISGVSGATPAVAITFRGRLTPAGELLEFGGSESAVMGLESLVHGLMQLFSPRLPDAGVEVGRRWEDTVETTATIDGIALTERSLNRYEAGAWTGFGDGQALPITTLSEYTLTGSGEQSGQPFTVSRQGRRLAHQYVGADGRYLGLISADTSRAEITSSLGFAVPIDQTRVDTLSIVP